MGTHPEVPTTVAKLLKRRKESARTADYTSNPASYGKLTLSTLKPMVEGTLWTTSNFYTATATTQKPKKIWLVCVTSIL